MPRRAERKPAGVEVRRKTKRGQPQTFGAQSVARGRCEAQRQRLAYESARILSEQGGIEFDRARRKAADRLGIGDKRCWPDNEEIQEALLQQRRLFHADEQEQTLNDLRRQALSAMREFAAFEPRLVGQTLDGTANREHGVELLLFAENPEDVALQLLDRNIPWQQRDDQFRYAGGDHLTHPVFSFLAGDLPIHLIVLPPQARRNPPLSPVSERPERGIGAAELNRLVVADV